ncbi:MAG: MMPL family transporter [bacterium]|nr:MMPL family transporter [bacterium]
MEIPELTPQNQEEKTGDSRWNRAQLFFRRRRLLTIISVLVLTVIFGLISVRMKINNDYDTWLPENDPITILYKKVNTLFSASGVVLVVLDLGDVFTPESLDRIRNVTEKLEAVEGVFSVLSLSNVLDFRKEGDTLEVIRLGERAGTTPESLGQFRKYVLDRELYAGSLVSEDGRMAAILINILDETDEVVVAEKIKALMEKEGDTRKIFLGGDPVNTVYINQFMNRDLSVVAPIAIFMILLLLFLSFRTFWGVFLPLLIVVISSIWISGIMTIFGWPFNVMTTAVIVLIFAMGSEYAVHVLNRFAGTPPGEPPVFDLGLPITVSALTTITGLATFALTRIAVLKWFGYEIAIALLLSFTLSLTLLPAILSYLKPTQISRPHLPDSHPDILGLWARRLGELSIRHRLALIGIFILVGIAAAYGISRIKTSVNLIEMLPEKSQPREASRILREHFGGSYPQTLYFEGNHGDPAVLRAMIEMENRHHAVAGFSGYTSIASLIAEENYVFNGSYSIPDTREKVASLWLLMEGDPLLKNLVTTNQKNSIISAYTKREDSNDLEEAALEVDRIIADHAGSELVTLDRAKIFPAVGKELKKIQITEAAEEIGALAAYYSGYKSGKELVPAIAEALDKRPRLIIPGAEIGRIAAESRNFIETQLFLSDPRLKDELTASIRGILGEELEERSWLENLSARFGPLLAGLPSGEGEAVSRDLAAFLAGEIRKLEVENAFRALGPVLPPGLGEHFTKRAQGVLEELVGQHPSFFKRKLEGLQIPETAVVSRSGIVVKQMGMPTWYEVFTRLLYQSQAWTSILAAFFVLVLIWIGLKSFRSGLFTAITVVVADFMVLGLMGALGVPLDYGTVLTGGLIIGLGDDGAIHLIYRYRKTGGKMPESLEIVGRGIITSNITTGAGFICLIFSQVKVMQNFGLINGLAIVIVTVLILIMIPVLVVTFLPIKEK